jgi:hypothetical protein
MTTHHIAKWSDEMRAQLLLKYKDKIDSLGEEEFFRQFDQIREECHSEVESSCVPNLVAFGGYRCGCTDLELDMASISPYCPHHDKPLSNKPEWVENTNNVPLGFEIYTEAQERQMLIGLIVDSVTEDEPASKQETVKISKRKPHSDHTLDMEDI